MHLLQETYRTHFRVIKVSDQTGYLVNFIQHMLLGKVQHKYPNPLSAAKLLLDHFSGSGVSSPNVGPFSL